MKYIFVEDKFGVYKKYPSLKWFKKENDLLQVSLQ